MDKRSLDNTFTEILPLLENIASGIKYKNNKRCLELNTIINETYLYLVDNLDKISNVDELQRFAIKFIKSNIGWTNSRMNKLDSLKGFDDFYGSFDESDELSNEDIEFKKDIERWYLDRLSILEEYRLQEVDKINQIVFDCYFHKGIRKGSDLSRHLGINKDYALRYIKVMINSIREYKNKKDTI